MRDPLVATKLESATPKRALRFLSTSLWYLVQLGALGAIVLSSFWGDMRRSREDSLRDGLLQRTSFANPFREERPLSITSRVVSLPQPAGTTPGALRLEVETRQMRFERGWTTVAAAPGAGRAPASAPRDWRIERIERRVGKTWESVPLVHNEEREAVGTSFVELEEGVNEFRVTYRDRAGHESSQNVRVRHVRTRSS